MTATKGFKLYVSLGAAQTRKRLKGFGHGVRKIASAGRNQAVIIHTATGAHRAALEAKFADVGFAQSEAGLARTTAPEATIELDEPWPDEAE